ncbi:MAG: histidine triad nucleotide-binding protein [Bacteroidota bacterium]
MDGCLFCRIAAGEVPAKIVYQDDLVVAFRDINPVAPTHILIIPRKHLADLREKEAAAPELWGAMIGAVQHLALTEGVSAEGFRIVANTGAKAGQSIFHLHLHLLGGREFNSL